MNRAVNAPTDALVRSLFGSLHNWTKTKENATNPSNTLDSIQVVNDLALNKACLPTAL